MRARFVNNVGEHHRFARLGFYSARERRSHLHIQVVADAFLVIERAVFLPNFARLLRHAGVEGDAFLRNGQEIPIYVVSHKLESLVESLIVKAGLVTLARTALLCAPVLRWGIRPQQVSLPPGYRTPDQGIPLR